MGKTAKSPPAQKRVERLYSHFERCQEAIDELKSDNEEVFEELSRLVAERNSALSLLVRAVRETKISIGPITVSKSRRRTFDGRYLYEHFAYNPEVRNSLVSLEFRVHPKEFDLMVQTGDIEPEIAQKAVVDIVETTRLLDVPHEMVVE